MVESLVSSKRERSAAAIDPLLTLKEAVAKSKKALNHKDTKAQRKPFLSAGRSLSRLGKNFVSP